MAKIKDKDAAHRGKRSEQQSAATRRPNNVLLIGLVYIALFLDNMLMTTIVPILPAVLRSFENTAKFGNITADLNNTIQDQPHFEGKRIGLLLGSKGFVQLVTNLIVGPLTNRLGYTVPMFFGFVVVTVSTITFAFAQSYWLLLVARSVQGMGSACCATSGLGMLAKSFTEPKERGAAVSFALGGLALGVLFGFPFGGLLYHWSGGKELPFLILAGIGLIEGLVQWIFLRPKIVKEDQKGVGWWKLLLDPYIAITAGAILVACAGIAALEPALPLWMTETLNASPQTIGLSFVPVTGAYLVGVHFLGPVVHRFGGWLVSLVGLLFGGISLCTIPLASNVYGFIAPNAFYGFFLGVFDAAVFPEMGNLVDKRHVGVYGSIYAVADSAVCLAFAAGPFAGASLMEQTSFSTTLWTFGGLAIFYSPLMLLLRKPATTTLQLFPDCTSGNKSTKVEHQVQMTSHNNI